MISVTVIKKEGQYQSLSCLGHAGYAESGRDIVCAAVSMLVINTINAVEAFTEDGFTLDTSEEEGLIRMTFTGEVSHDSSLLMDALVMGLRETERNYGKQFVKFTYKEV